MNAARVIDLTQPIRHGMPVYPGDPEVSLRSVLTVERDGVAVTEITLGSHTGTHLDAPSHVRDGVPGVDAVPLEWLVGAAEIFAVRVPPGQTRSVALAELTVTADRLERPLPDTLPRIVCLASGWDAYFASRSLRMRHPAVEVDLAVELWDRGARVLGVDALSPDLAACGAELPLHRFWLGRGGVIVENLCNLLTLPARCELSLLPLSIPGIDGAPVRAVAYAPDERPSA